MIQRAEPVGHTSNELLDSQSSHSVAFKVDKTEMGFKSSDDEIDRIEA
jgi:hypothetical protein